MPLGCRSTDPRSLPPLNSYIPSSLDLPTTPTTRYEDTWHAFGSCTASSVYEFHPSLVVGLARKWNGRTAMAEKKKLEFADMVADRSVMRQKTSETVSIVVDRIIVDSLVEKVIEMIVRSRILSVTLALLTSSRPSPSHSSSSQPPLPSSAPLLSAVLRYISRGTRCAPLSHSAPRQ